MTAETFDRSRPLYRVFDLGAGDRQWWTVELDNTPGVFIGPAFSEILELYIADAPWKAAFEAAFEKHRKATVYANPAETYEVPEGCTAVLKSARIFENAYGETVAIGRIFGDVHGRFLDGRVVTTSALTQGLNEHGVVVTRSGSTYKIELRETDGQD